MGELIDGKFPQGNGKKDSKKPQKEGKLVPLPETPIQKEKKQYKENEFFNNLKNRFSINNVINLKSEEDRKNIQDKIEFINNLVVSTSYDVYMESLKDLRDTRKDILIDTALKISLDEIVKRPSYSMALFNLICGSK